MNPPVLEGVRNKLLNLLWASSQRWQGSSHQSEHLKRLLRRYPTWSDGHRLLSEASLACDDIATAYASAICYRHLAKSSPISRSNALLLLGKCFLRRGDWRSALSFLGEAQSICPESFAVKEEIAAAHMLGGDYSAARSALNQIPHESKSPEAKAAEAFVKSKVN